jgi:hypothetical protein
MKKYQPLPPSKHPWPYPGLDNREAAFRMLETLDLAKGERMQLAAALTHNPPDLDVFVPNVHAAVVARCANE